MKLPLTTTWPLVGLLCLCSCTSPVFVGTDEMDMSTSMQVASETSGAHGTSPTSTDPASSAGSQSEDATSGVATTDEPSPDLDLGSFEFETACGAPALDCDAHSEGLDHALGLNCEGGGVTSSGSLDLAGPPGSWRVVGQLGDTTAFAPRHGARAVLLSTGVAGHVELTAKEVQETTKCSQIGLPCPSTEFPETYDLDELPPPIEVEAIDCPPGQPPPGAGDCSQTVDAQWLGGAPRRAHDYTELRFAAEVPPGVGGIRLQAAFFTAEYPPRFPTGYNDLALIWLESEHWTGNFALHPSLDLPLAAESLKGDFDRTGADPALASFAFAGHAAMDWMTLSATVKPGETLTLIAAVFDVGDAQVDSALLLDDLRWDCIAPTHGRP